ncbi:hypothetical protein GOODEAATRI_015001, partial [Goodea atripinnis]
MRDPMAMERANLLNMAKLSIKGLIESALSFGRTLDSDYPPLQQFFVVMEHCLKHGLRVSAQRYYDPEQLCVLQDPSGQSQGMASSGTYAETAGRLPATPHHSKRPPQVHPRQKKTPHDFYEDSALMLEEEGAVIVGLLVGLNVIDANLCVKGEDLDSQLHGSWSSEQSRFTREVQLEAHRGGGGCKNKISKSKLQK